MADPTASDALLATKLSVPRGPKAVVVRDRLLDRLDVGVRGPVTLVAAPAGAGKSALLSSWIAEGRPPGPVAWLSLDTDDADRRRFWRGVLASLAQATGDDAVAELAVSPREPMSMRLVASALADALDGVGQPVVLVLDDLHQVIDAVHEDLERLVRMPPPALRIVVLTRADPPIGLGRLRLEGRLTEIRAADLSFSLEEAGALFAAMGTVLAPEDVATVWRRTEGWAAALRLAGVSLQHHPDPAAFIEHFAGTDATISDYLVSEVLARQPPELRDFLLRTSIVDTLSAELADALTGGTDGHAMLARLEHGGVLTTPLDERGAWHRYHPLFAELLRAELRAQLPPDVAPLHRRAATWLAAHGDNAAALRHAAAGGAWDLAAELTTTRWFPMMINGEMGTLRPILETMPRELVETCPELALAFGGALLARGDHAGAQPYLRRAEEGEALVASGRRAPFAACRAAMSLYEGRLRGDPKAALQAARELLRGDVVLVSGDLSSGVRSFVLGQLGIVELWTGDLDSARAHLERAYANALDAGNDWTALVATAHLAVARAFRGEVQRALRHADEAVRLASRRGWGSSEPAGAAYCVQAAVAIQRGQREEAQALVGHASEALHETRERPLRAVHAVNRSLLLSDAGEPEAALNVLQAARDEIGDWPLLAPLEDEMLAREALLRAAIGEREQGLALLERDGATSIPVANALAKLRLLEGDPRAARDLLAPHLGDGRDAPADAMPVSTRAEAWLLDALALDALAETDAAATSLERSLDLAEPAGLNRLLVEHGNRVRPLLHRHVRNGTAHPAIVGAVLEAIEHRGDEGSRAVAVLLAEPLSDREHAILRYLPTMMSNHEIAAELFVSVNTVKTHLKAIYRKLDASGRREAVQRGRELGLMP